MSARQCSVNVSAHMGTSNACGGFFSQHYPWNRQFGPLKLHSPVKRKQYRPIDIFHCLVNTERIFAWPLQMYCHSIVDLLQGINFTIITHSIINDEVGYSATHETFKCSRRVLQPCRLLELHKIYDGMIAVKRSLNGLEIMSHIQKNLLHVFNISCRHMKKIFYTPWFVS